MICPLCSARKPAVAVGEEKSANARCRGQEIWPKRRPWPCSAPVPLSSRWTATRTVAPEGRTGASGRSAALAAAAAIVAGHVTASSSAKVVTADPQ